jgi:hypothetical protein
VRARGDLSDRDRGVERVAERRAIAARGPAPRDQREEAVLAGQRSLGNAAVARAIQQHRGSPLLMRTLVLERNSYSDEREPEVWGLVKPFLQGVYGRRKALRALFAQNQNDNWSVADLAAFLDEPYERKKARARPTWTAGVLAWLTGTYGGTQHRRHIVMSSLMRDAVYAVSDGFPKTPQDEQKLAALYSSLVGLVSKRNHNSLLAAETDLVSLLHNNPANLIIDKGNWNSAIGALAQKLKSSVKGYAEAWEEIKGDRDKKLPAYLDQIGKGGWEVPIQRQIIDFWKDYAAKNPPSSADDLRDLLEDMFDNAAVDMMTTQSTKETPMGPLLSCHTGFAQVTSSMDPGTLQNVVTAFIEIGKKNDPPYEKVWP